MEFREGMLGVVVVALALTGALFASYFAGIESETRQYTDYNYLADVSGLFDYDKSPTYIEFDPSSNYTGYYSSTTGEYWPVDKVDYVPNVNPDTKESRANNYRINLEPLVDNTETKDISVLTERDVPGLSEQIYAVTYAVQNYNPQGGWSYMAVPKSTTLTQLIDQFGYGDYDRIKIASVAGLDEDPTGGTTENPKAMGWTVFFPKSWVSDHGGYQYEYSLYCAQKSLYEQWQWGPNINPGLKMEKLALSCEINVKTGLVTLYWDNEFKNSIGTFGLDSVCMAYSDKTDPHFTPTITLSDTAVITVQKFPPASYLDPNYGVALKE